MQTYVNTEEIQAEQWNGKESNVVKLHKGCGYRMCDICGGADSKEHIYFIQQGYNNYLRLYHGSWIIRKGNIFSVMGNKTFQELYKLKQ